MALGPRIASKDALKAYIIRQLGGEAVTVELTDLNLDDAIEKTLEDYIQTAYSGVQERYLPVTLIPGVNEYILPYDVFAVLKVNSQDMQGIGNSVPSNLFSINNFIAADLYKPGTAKIDLVGYEAVNEMIETMNIMFSRQISFDYNSISKVLHLFAPNVGEHVMLQVYTKLNLEGTVNPSVSGAYQEENIYGEKWIKKMASAYAMLQWGINISLKYSGSILPNGGSLNGTAIMEMAERNIDKYTEELHSVYELPTDFIIG